MLSILSHVQLVAVGALAVFFGALIVFLAGIAGLSPLIWFVLAIGSVVAQSALFYNIGRVREKLGAVSLKTPVLTEPNTPTPRTPSAGHVARPS